MVDRCHTSGHISTGLNNQRLGGRVPSQRESLECRDYWWLFCTRYHRGTGALDVHESNSLKQEGETR
jgi:hypothetical protein